MKNIRKEIEGGFNATVLISGCFFLGLILTDFTAHLTDYIGWLNIILLFLYILLFILLIYRNGTQ